MWRAQKFPLIPVQAGIQSDNPCARYFGSWVPVFHLRAPRFGGLEPAEARDASEGWVAGTGGD
jgi:hypothetical protein